jgi:hypothetical protein
VFVNCTLPYVADIDQMWVLLKYELKRFFVFACLCMKNMVGTVEFVLSGSCGSLSSCL